MKNKIVKLKRISEEYKNLNLDLDIKGIVIDENNDKSIVVFMNNSIIGDLATLEINNNDLTYEKVDFPDELYNKYIENNIMLLKNKNYLKKLTFNEFDEVRLIVEDEKYAKFGVHKDYLGTVAINYAVNNELLVDFTGIDDNGQFYGDCISVNIKDLELVTEYKKDN